MGTPVEKTICRRGPVEDEGKEVFGEVSQRQELAKPIFSCVRIKMRKRRGEERKEKGTIPLYSVFQIVIEAVNEQNTLALIVADPPVVELQAEVPLRLISIRN